MRTVVVQGGWRAWLALLVAGAMLAVVGVAFGLLVLVLLALLTALVVGDRMLRAVGLRRSAPVRTPWPRSGGGADGAIEGEYRVVERPATVRPVVSAPRAEAAPGAPPGSAGPGS